MITWSVSVSIIPVRWGTRGGQEHKIFSAIRKVSRAGSGNDRVFNEGLDNWMARVCMHARSFVPALCHGVVRTPAPCDFDRVWSGANQSLGSVLVLSEAAEKTCRDHWEVMAKQ